MENKKKKNWVEVVAGMAALLGMFLPYVDEISFFQSTSGPDFGIFAPTMTVMIALATVLYALGQNVIPFVISLLLLTQYIKYPIYVCWTYGLVISLLWLRIGAWFLLLGLSVMAIYPLFRWAKPGNDPMSVKL